jgi:predicted permease
VILGCIGADRHFLHLYPHTVHQIMIIISSVPLAANTVTMSTELRLEPEKAGVAVLLSTIFSLFFIPFMALLFLL